MRFKVGDLARVAVAMRRENQGKIVEIIVVGPWSRGDIATLPNGEKLKCQMESADYLTDITLGTNERGRLTRGAVKDWQLAPIDPPAEPKSLTRSEEIENV